MELEDGAGEDIYALEYAHNFIARGFERVSWTNPDAFNAATRIFVRAHTKYVPALPLITGECRARGLPRPSEAPDGHRLHRYAPYKASDQHPDRPHANNGRELPPVLHVSSFFNHHVCLIKGRGQF